jgi:cell wall-associated NlpC family hydrolase
VTAAPSLSDRVLPRLRVAVRILAIPAALLVLTPAASPVRADPKLADVERQLTSVGEKMEQTTEQYNNAREDLAASKARHAALSAQAATIRKDLGKYETQVDAYAALRYRGDMSTLTSVLSSGSPQNAMDQLSYLTYLSQQHKDELNALLDAQKKLSAAQQKIDLEVAEQVKQENTLRAKRAAILADVGKWEALRKKLAPDGSSSGPPPIYQGPAVGRARTVLKFAYAQIGKPYVWGAAGMSSFDCSGLTMAAWARVGISMPHSASRQYARFPKVPRGQLQPGDLVFFYSDIHHVGIYIGGGQMISAPHTGDVVKIQDAFRSDFVGAGRP